MQGTHTSLTYRPRLHFGPAVASIREQLEGRLIDELVQLHDDVYRELRRLAELGSLSRRALQEAEFELRRQILRDMANPEAIPADRRRALRLSLE